jgi:amino acid transporter/mannitol/fructose-specific phosphotransferase system IIA component (Ntr-type)
MPPHLRAPRLHRELGLRDVYAIATGATLSAGLFLLPGPAAAQAGPAVVLAYLIAAVPMVPAMFSVVELATAMPRAGGAYYFLDRSLGPLAGTIGGLGTWLALVLKTAFALIGMGAYVAVFHPEAPHRLIAGGFAVAFGALNLYGTRRTGSFQLVMVAGLLGILALFIAGGLPAVDPARFQGFFDAGFDSILATAGLVYISYVGVTNVASVSEEVRDPERNLPRGIFLALGSAVVIYALCTSVMVGVVPGDVLAGHLTPAAEAASRFAGRGGAALISVAAVMAFASVANAGILAASRYPLAMSRDGLLPPVLRGLSQRGTPTAAVLLNVGVILALVLLLDPVRIAKLASAFQLLIFGLLCGAVMVMRESGLSSYDPGFRSPGYPWMQIGGMLAACLLIAQMGWLPVLFTSGLVVVGIAWYRGYALARVDRHGAIYHVFERLGRRRFEGLDRELRSILKEKGPRDQDAFEEVIAQADVLEVPDATAFEDLVRDASRRLGERLHCAADALERGFLEGTRTGATPVAGGVALPHLRLAGLSQPALILARASTGLRIATADSLGDVHDTESSHAVFFLISPEGDPSQHLRMLAHLASRVEESHFLEEWLQAADDQALRACLLRHEHTTSLVLRRGAPGADWIDRPLAELGLPQGCLVAVIHRGDRTFAPGGRTLLQEGDVLTVVGEPSAIGTLRARFPA